jgi:DNA-binding transcriptional ArsR family regulator
VTVFATEARGFVSPAGASGTDMPVDDSGASGAGLPVDVFPTEARGLESPAGAVFPAEARGSASPAGASGADLLVDVSGASAAGLRDPGRVFAALADPRRRELLELLADTPGASAGALAARLPVSRQAVAQHLAVLEECALVTRRRAGRQVLFSVRPEGLQATADWLLARTAAWLG